MAVLMKEKIIKICDLIMKGLAHIGIDLNDNEKVTDYLFRHNTIIVTFYSYGQWVNSVRLMRKLNMDHMDFTQASMLAILADYDKDFGKYPFSVPALVKNMITSLNAEKVIDDITNIHIQLAPLHVISVDNDRPMKEIYDEAKQALNDIGINVKELVEAPTRVSKLCTFLRHFLDCGCFRYDRKMKTTGNLRGIFCKGVFSYSLEDEEYEEDEFPLIKDFGFMSIASAKRLKRLDIVQIKLEFPGRLCIDLYDGRIIYDYPRLDCYKKLGL